MSHSCYHSVKDNKSESKSQPEVLDRLGLNVVIILSKIINLKANHNWHRLHSCLPSVVIILSKIINLKANHNQKLLIMEDNSVVIILSKIINLKANHNIVSYLH